MTLDPAVYAPPSVAMQDHTYAIPVDVDEKKEEMRTRRGKELLSELEFLRKKVTQLKGKVTTLDLEKQSMKTENNQLRSALSRQYAITNKAQKQNKILLENSEMTHTEKRLMEAVDAIDKKTFSSRSTQTSLRDFEAEGDLVKSDNDERSFRREPILTESMRKALLGKKSGQNDNSSKAQINNVPRIMVIDTNRVTRLPFPVLHLATTTQDTLTSTSNKAVPGSREQNVNDNDEEITIKEEALPIGEFNADELVLSDPLGEIENYISCDM